MRNNSKQDDLIILDGIVKNIFPGANFDVEFSNGHHVKAYLSGKLKLNSINIIVGDLVRVEIPKSNLSIGKIIYRTKNKNASGK